MKTELATIGGGCFWCTEAVYEETKGILNVLSGYSGGHVINPSYREVSEGRTGHAEVIQISFNPEIISYKKIIEIFFKTHNPTTLNQQGADRGNQYRSIILYHSEKQKETAEKVIDEITNLEVFADPVITELKEYEHFYMAEEYHQDFFKKNPEHRYCNVVIKPKINKFRKDFTGALKTK